MTRDDLLAQLSAEHAGLNAILDGSTAEQLAYAPPGRWSAGDILRHLIDFHDDVLQGLRELARGESPSWLAVRDWNARNAEKARAWPEAPLADVRGALNDHQAELERQLQALSEEQLSDPLYRAGFRVAADHYFEHAAGIQERLAEARGDVRAATIHWVDIARRELLALIRRIPMDAYDESLPGKWSIKEILLHLAVRDRMWTEIYRTVIAGGPGDWPHTMDELNTWNQAAVGNLAHLPPQQVLYVLGEARGAWNEVARSAPDWLVADERYRQWARRRFDHDRWHLPQISERYRNWRERNRR